MINLQIDQSLDNPHLKYDKNKQKVSFQEIIFLFISSKRKISLSPIRIQQNIGFPNRKFRSFPL